LEDSAYNAFTIITFSLLIQFFIAFLSSSELTKLILKRTIGNSSFFSPGLYHSYFHTPFFITRTLLKGGSLTLTQSVSSNYAHIGSSCSYVNRPSCYKLLLPFRYYISIHLLALEDFAYKSTGCVWIGFWFMLIRRLCLNKNLLS